MQTKNLKIWFDVITPKDVLFFEPMITRLAKTNRIMLTTRDYREAVDLAKIRGMRTKMVGRHGGGSLIGKLRASAQRIEELTGTINKFDPDLVISLCSPEASRVAFGLGIKHVAFSNVVHYTAMMRLSVPLIDKLLVPKHISKGRFVKFGIAHSDIIQYNAMDESVIVKNSSAKPRQLKIQLDKDKTILFRPYENQAAYARDVKFDTIGAIKSMVDGLPDYNIVVLGRYTEQIKEIKRKFAGEIVVLDKVVDSESIFSVTDVFVGSGGTMTSESVLRGLPTISYEGIPNADEKHLVRARLLRRCTDPKKIPNMVKSVAAENSRERHARVKKFLCSMENPYDVLIRTIRLLK